MNKNDDSVFNHSELTKITYVNQYNIVNRMSK